MKEVSQKKILNLFVVFLTSLMFLGTFYFSPLFAEETIEEVEEKIDDRQDQIIQLEKEIESSEEKIKSYQGKEKTLKSEITNLNYQEQRLAKNILEKEVKIDNLEKSIVELIEDLDKNALEQKNRRENIAKAIIFINKFSDQNPLEILILEKSLSGFTDTFNTTKRIQEKLKKEVEDLKEIEKETKIIKVQKEADNDKVSKEKDLLADQKEISKKNKYVKQNLLKQTKNQEKYYQQLLTEKQKQIEAFYKEIFELESKLQILIDPASLPNARRGLFEWPVPEKNLWITQYYGVTPWRKKYANGTPHRGIDFGVVVGTPMYAIANGIISGTGDNEKVCTGVQYGKWITVDHENNLSSLYAHLSMIKVSAGDKVKEGDIIGYSGNTGYSTGPHLHFSIYATKGMEIQTIKHSYPGRCYQKEFHVPIVAGNAYMNPLNYMPKHDKY